MQRIDSLIALGRNFSTTLYDGVVRVTLMHNPPFVIVDGEQGNCTYRGYLVELWESIADALDLRYTLLAPNNGGFGNRLENGTWTGIVGDLAEGRADFGLTWISYRDDRSRVISYLDKIPVMYSDYQFFVRAGDKRMPDFTPAMFLSLLRPLHENVWLVLLLSFFIIALVLNVCIHFCQATSETSEMRRESSYGSCFLSTFMTVMGQGWPATPNSTPARIATISAWIMGLLIGTNYTANLISYLTITTPVKPISSLAELVSQPDWTVATEAGLGDLADWATSSSSAERRLYQMVTRGERYLLLEGSLAAYRRAIQPRMAVYYDLDLMFFAVGEDACRLLPLSPRVAHSRPQPAYMVIRKGLPRLHERITLVLHKLYQGGNINRLRLKWFRGGADICSSHATFTPLGVADLLAVLVIVPLATLVSMAVLGGEMAVIRYRRRAQQRRRVVVSGQPQRQELAH